MSEVPPVEAAQAPTAGATRPGPETPLAIEVRGLRKAFRVPDQKVDSLKERVTHPLTRIEHRTLHALRDVSFDVRRGEMFGIVGRNGSGKSTLLKVLASIYAPDAGTVRAAGRMAPFIELGVGFNPELPAADNILLNGVLMGLTRRESQRRTDAVLDFAELGAFADLKLKNYSSGMMVRLAFSIMVEADADIMLVDEVLAVGDAAFAQKCMDVFHDRRRAGTTIVLVTHDMAAVQGLCHRAMLIHDGVVAAMGDPEEVALHYYRLNFAGPIETEPGKEAVDRIPLAATDNARLLHARLLDPQGAEVDNLEQGTPIELDVLLEAGREMDAPIFVVHVVNEDGVVIAGFTRTLEEHVAPGRRVRLAGRVDNPLVPGRYFVDCWLRRDGTEGDMGLQAMRLLGFHVFGTAPRHGLVELGGDVRPVLEDPEVVA